MEEQIKKLFTPEIIAEMTSRYEILPDDLEPLDGFESFIYRYCRADQDYILRISHSLRRTEAMIRGEVDWINYLVAGGVNASQVIPSFSGNLVEPVRDNQGGYFIGAVFEKAPGKPIGEIGDTDAFFQTLGRTLGKMHALTKEYTPGDSLAFRPQWDDPIMLIDESWLPAGEEVAGEKYFQIVERCAQLSKGEGEYGLVHFDAHAGNFFVDESGQIHLFDFDDCHYTWFANDIAISLFYMVMGAEDPAGFTRHYLKNFIQGYQTENAFNPDWLELIPLFLKMREIDLYAIIHRSFDVENLDDDWCIWYLEGRKRKIEQEVPYIDLDFSSLRVLFTAD